MLVLLEDPLDVGISRRICLLIPFSFSFKSKVRLPPPLLLLLYQGPEPASKVRDITRLHPLFACVFVPSCALAFAVTLAYTVYGSIKEVLVVYSEKALKPVDTRDSQNGGVPRERRTKFVVVASPGTVLIFIISLALHVHLRVLLQQLHLLPSCTGILLASVLPTTSRALESSISHAAS